MLGFVEFADKECTDAPSLPGFGAELEQEWDANERTKAIVYTAAVGALRALGIERGDMVMMHASVRGPSGVMGGPNMIIQGGAGRATPDGTLMMYAGWNDIPDFVGELFTSERQRYYDEHPPLRSGNRAGQARHSILAEFFRTWPGAHRSLNAEASMAAVGAQAEWLTRDHPSDYGYGPGSPLAKLVESGGKVLMLGARRSTRSRCCTTPRTAPICAIRRSCAIRIRYCATAKGVDRRRGFRHRRSARRLQLRGDRAGLSGSGQWAAGEGR